MARKRGAYNKSLVYQWNALKTMTINEAESALRSGAMTAAKKLRLNTGLLLASECKKYNTPNKKWPYTVVLGIMIKKYHKGDMSTGVHVMGHRALPGTHRLRWLVNGTVDRYTKKGQFRGRIDPGNQVLAKAVLITPIDKIINDTVIKRMRSIGKKHMSK